MISNGRAIASDILARVRSLHTGTPRVRAIVLDPSSATKSYLAIKKARAKDAGMELEVVELHDAHDTEAVIGAVRAQGADAVIVQLPLPSTIDTPRVLSHIPVEKDADVLSEKTYERFVQDEPGALLPPVVRAVKEILADADIMVSGMRACVVGEGKLVGKPVAIWLQRQGATVSVVTKREGNMSLLKEADIIVSGAGQAGLITKDMVREGAVLIDAGTSESNGTLAGDISPECQDKARLFTPVPGGVGPVAVACLFNNVADLEAYSHGK